MMMNNMIDWDGKLEAVNAITGKVRPVVNANTTKRGDNIWIVDLDHLILSFYGDGTGRDHEWRIRNVVEAKGGEEWGPSIEVGGVRPEWLGGGEKFHAKGDKLDWFGIATTGKPHVWNEKRNHEPSWSGVDYIRLPANHPHYRTEKPAEAPLGVLTGVERLERLEAFVRRLAGGLVGDAEAEAEALLPVDPDMLKAREIMAGRYPESADNINAGKWDENAVADCVAGIKAGREMGK